MGKTLGSSILARSEYVPVEEEGAVKDREAPWLKGGKLKEPYEEDFGWYQTEQEVDKKKAEEETYLVFLNYGRMRMKSGVQAFNYMGS